MGQIKVNKIFQPRTESAITVGSVSFRMQPQEVADYCHARGIEPYEFFNNITDRMLEHFDEWFKRETK